MDLHVDKEKKEGYITGEIVGELALAKEEDKGGDKDSELVELPDELTPPLREA